MATQIPATDASEGIILGTGSATPASAPKTVTAIEQAEAKYFELDARSCTTGEAEANANDRLHHATNICKSGSGSAAAAAAASAEEAIEDFLKSRAEYGVIAVATLRAAATLVRAREAHAVDSRRASFANRSDEVALFVLNRVARRGIAQGAAEPR